MPRDVILGEGYDGDTQIVSYSPGHHNGEFWLDDGSSTLMQMGDIPDQGYGVSGMGDIAAEWAELLASDSLDKLRSALGKVADQLILLGSYRISAYNGYLQAKALQDGAVKLAGGMTITVPFAGTIPNPSVVPAMIAFQTAVEAVKFFARLVNQTAQLQIVYMKIAEQLSASGLTTDANMVNTSLYQVNKFIIESDAIFRVIPEYAAATQAVVQAAANERRLWGVDPNNYLDPRWYQAYIAGADKVVPMPQSAGGVSGMGDFSGLSLGPAVIIALAAGIAIIVSSIIAMVKLLPNVNLKAQSSVALLQQAQDRKAAVEAQMRAQGKSQAEIDAAKESIDADTGKNIEKIPEPGSLFGSILGPLGIVAAAVVAAVVLK